MTYNQTMIKGWLADLERIRDSECEEVSDGEIMDVRWRAIKHYLRLNKRIDYCRALVREKRDAFLCCALAELYDQYDFAYGKDIIHKRPVRYWCLMAIRADRTYSRAWAILSCVHYWLAIVEKAKSFIYEDRRDFAEATELFIQEFEEKDCSSQEVTSRNKLRQETHIDKAIYFVKRAIKLKPACRVYRGWLRYYCSQKTEICNDRKLTRDSKS